MVTVPQIVDELVSTSPYLEEALAQEIINLSSLARRLKPQIQQRVYKEIQTGAIVMALKRLTVELKHRRVKTQKALDKLSDITVRSNIVELTYVNSLTLDKRHQEVEVFAFSHGVFETTFFTTLKQAKDLEKALQKETLKAKFTNLSAITLILPKEAVYEPGLYYSILKILAWQGLSFVEVISSYTELTIFIEKDKIDRAFSALKNLV